MVSIPIKRSSEAAAIPTYATEGDAGADLRSVEEIALRPLQRALVKTNVHVAIPLGYVGLVHPRSGLALKKGITVLNAPGTIDAGYRGDVGVILVNLSDQEVTLAAGERIAQLVLQEFATADFVEVDELDESTRGVGGFGSTGTH
ncbi:deoxyuridine 5'-triphosphate nucleotidohydrolase (plasmid) [Frondihabitans sucicola]|uniref:Deoxyuridine 5'-triphosphate nucleotidohydrolase n=1 Tax=Frondihabitans sucicola TaxID=1268041 RepID=A0ABM8GVF8_9MICO|nr:dUTP diphosphatase [Frondihabitans sucicola]BDZ52464.1 deoxyuridine 5'-triphosphate nucleotidohydrolase [Frondihabitans sucicola]